MPLNAAIYISDPSMLNSRVFQSIPAIKSSESLSEGSDAIGVRFTCDWGRITMNFMPEGQLAGHLNGFAGYARTVVPGENLVFVLARIKHVRMCLGCVIEHDDDRVNEVYEFLGRFNSAMNGLLFLDDTIYDWSGQVLGGPATDA